MSIIKIHTTTSTNDLLKEMSRQNDVDNFTIVWALHQTAGRGQRGNTWLDEDGKNLTFSLLIKLNDFEIQRQFELNQMISLAVLKVLKEYLPLVQIKWPNDIMADKKKIAGILIENTLHGNYITSSIIGIGLNVNQIEFDTILNNAISMKKITGIDYDLELVLNEILDSIQLTIKMLPSNILLLKKEYLENLMGWQTYYSYSTANGKTFQAKISAISPEGKLILETTEIQILEFGFQEVKMVL